MKKRQNKFSYKVIVRRKNKKGFFYYVEKKDGKEKITSRHEWENLQHTKQELKKVYKKGAKEKLKEYQKEIKNIDKKEKKKESEKPKPKRKYFEEFVWGNSGASAFEDYFLFNNDKLFISLNPFSVTETEIRTPKNKVYQKKADDLNKKQGNRINKKTFSITTNFNKSKFVKITNKNILDGRTFLSEVTDFFYERWQELKGTPEEPDSPQLKFCFEVYEDNFDTVLNIGKTMFSFEETIFFKKMIQLFFNYFGK